MKNHSEIERLFAEAGLNQANQPKALRAFCALKSLHHDSRHVDGDSAFIAVEGLRTDGHRHIPKVQKKCSVVVANKAYKPPRGLAHKFLLVNDTRLLVRNLGGAFYGHPSKQCKLLGVTGSNGKTSTVAFLERGLLAQGEVVGALGTLGHRLNGETIEAAANTTPNNLDVQRLLRRMVDGNATTIVLEVSSHALAEGRLHDLHFDAAAFLNISREHLDFHRSMQRYLDAKLSLFSLLARSDKRFKRGVVSLYQPSLRSPLGIAKHFAEAKHSYPIRYFVGARQAHHLQKLPRSIAQNLYTHEWKFLGRGPFAATYSLRQGGACLASFDTKLMGDFYAENITASLLVACDLDPIGKSLSLNWKPDVFDRAAIPGRMELVVDAKDRRIIVDYAHTPEALRLVLLGLRRARKGKLVCLFGCGGERDAGKRRLMGRVASRYADEVFVTSDNPRGEKPEDIIDAIMEGVLPSKLPAATTIADRKQAIEEAVKGLGSGETLLLAGKGHEATQTIGDKKIPMDDRQLATNAWKRFYPKG